MGFDHEAIKKSSAVRCLFSQALSGFQIMSGGSKDYNREHGGPEGMDPNGVIEGNWNEIVDNFDDMNLKESLLRGIYAYGFEKPSAIQQRAIIPCIKGKTLLPLG